MLWRCSKGELHLIGRNVLQGNFIDNVDIPAVDYYQTFFKCALELIEAGKAYERTCGAQRGTCTVGTGAECGGHEGTQGALEVCVWNDGGCACAGRGRISLRWWISESGMGWGRGRCSLMGVGGSGW